MRNLIIDLALSAGQEGLDTPPSLGVVATDLEVAQNQAVIARGLVDLNDSQTEVSTARQYITDLTRLGGGLEGLMIEVSRVENKTDPSVEELSALRAAALSVRRELLNEDERRLVDELAEGRLEGSVEGLGDLLRNVGTKLGFAVGNFWDGIKRNFSGSKTVMDAVDRKIDDLVARITTLDVDNFERTLSKDDAVMFSLDGKVDPIAVTTDIVAAMEDWFYRPMSVIIARIEALTVHLAATLAAKTEEEYTTVVESQADLYTTPIPEGSKKVDVVNGKYFIFDLYDVHSSYGGRQRTIYVARPNHNTQINSPQYDNASALGVSFAQITLLRGMKAQPTKVKLTKEELLNGLLQLQRAVKELNNYIQNQDIAVKAYRAYCQSTAGYNDFQKNEFVTKLVLHRMSIQASAILSLFEMTCLPVTTVAGDLDKLSSILKSFVYSSDLSKG